MLLYALGEALTDEVSADSCGEFQQPVALLMSGTIPHLEHRHVAGAVLECCVRFSHMHVCMYACEQFVLTTPGTVGVTSAAPLVMLTRAGMRCCLQQVGRLCGGVWHAMIEGVGEHCAGALREGGLPEP